MNPILHAQALAALPEMPGSELPRDIQVFPPGDAVEFTLQDYPGETFKLQVDATVAAQAQADLERLNAAERQGRGSAPFADKNHEDAEATLHPIRFFWGGNDPKSGGVRMETKWTPFGAALVRAKAFKYFSGNFLFNKTAGKFLGLINENVGGLVNRPGFASQQAFARADVGFIAQLAEDPNLSRQLIPSAVETPLTFITPDERARLEKVHGIDLTRPAGVMDHEFILLLNQLAAKNGTLREIQMPDLIQAEPALWDAYRATLTGGDAPAPAAADMITALAKGYQGQGARFEAAFARAKADVLCKPSSLLVGQRLARAVENRARQCVSATTDWSAAFAKATVELLGGNEGQPCRAAAVKAFTSHARAHPGAKNLCDLEAEIAFARTEAGQWLYQQCRL